MDKKTFTYTPGDSNIGIIEIVTMLVLGAASLYARNAGYVIAIKRLSLGQYSFLIAGIIFMLGFVFYVYSYIDDKKKQATIKTLTQEQKTITMEGDIMKFFDDRTGQFEQVTVKSSDIEKYYREEDDDTYKHIIYVDEPSDDGTQRVSSRYEFRSENFDDADEYNEFVIMIQKFVNGQEEKTV